MPNMPKREEAKKRRRELAITKAIAFCLMFVTILMSISLVQARELARELTEEETEVGEVFRVSYLQDTRKVWSDWRLITATGTDQWWLQQSRMAYTDTNGLRRFSEKGYYMVAMNRYYGSVGDVVLITMRNGCSYRCLVADQLTADPDFGPVIGFIVDSDYIPEKCQKTGDMSYASSQFAGMIVTVSNLGKVADCLMS